jgi:2-polyprenyl-6-methoxyphenol hydroxylase-like FAD-dependent oxidoreductase
MLRVLIAGGGLGGLATALRTGARGQRVTVLERRPELVELGAGIQLAPNAFRALHVLGVGARVRERAVLVTELRFMDGTTGRRVASMPLTGRYRERFGDVYAVAHRGDLYRALVDACRTNNMITLRTGVPVVGYEQDAATVTALTASGERVVGDVLIGADGLRSAVRRQLVGDGEPRLVGHTIHRALVPMVDVPVDLRWNAVTLWAGPRWHFVHYPIAGGELLNLAVTRDDHATRELVGVPVPRRRVLDEFATLPPTAARLLGLGQGWRTWTLGDRDPVERWTDGRVTLLGDAAHPMVQYAAQGACMALEDAVVLGDLLGHNPAEVHQRLEKYNAERRERTARTQLVSRALGTELYHAEGAEALARNKMLSSLSVDQLYDKVSWLHGA